MIMKILSGYLEAHFENFIFLKVDSGSYNSASEVIREAFRLLELEKKMII